MNENTASWEDWTFRQLLKLIRWIGPNTLVQWTLLLCLLGSLVTGLASITDRLLAASLTQPILAGALTGWLLARTRLRGWLVAVISGGLGLVLVIIFVGDLVSTASNLVSQLNILASENLVNAGSIWNSNSPEMYSSQAALAQSWLELSTSLHVLADRTSSWANNVWQGSAGYEPALTILVWSFVLWAVGVWSSWWLWRRQQPMLAALPGGALLAVSLAYAGGKALPLTGVLASTLLLLAWVGFKGRLDFWLKEKIDYADELQLDVSLAALSLTLVLVFVAFFSPAISMDRLEEILRPFRPDSGVVSQAIGEPLGLPQKPAEPAPRHAFTSPESTGMPRQHLLRAGPEVTEQLVMTISTGDLPKIPVQSLRLLTPPAYYWRGLTYDHYLGNGWETTTTQEISYTAQESTRTKISLSSGLGQEKISASLRKQFPLKDVPFLKVVIQDVKPQVDLNNLVYMAGDVLAVDQGYQVAWRIPPDPFSSPEVDLFSVSGETHSYRAWSLLAQPSETDLRAAGEEYPPWVMERFLALPNSLPQRVRDLAVNLTAGLTTPYDRALAIESYLRSFPYTLDLPAPPQDRDLVDYFLFDLKKGYCDYYASAMVVLARAAGIPARLAIGYSSGNYDPYTAEYSIKEKNGHSWPELFFPGKDPSQGVGWVAFEPTASLPTIARSDQFPGRDNSLGDYSSPESVSAAHRAELFRTYWLAGLVGVAVLGLVFWMIWSLMETWLIWRRPPERLVAMVYRLLYKQGKLFSTQANTADTPSEFAERFTSRLDLISQRWSEAFRKFLRRVPFPRGVLPPIQQEIIALVGLYNRSIYSSQPLAKEAGQEAINGWKWLRWRFWWLRWLKYWLKF